MKTPHWLARICSAGLAGAALLLGAGCRHGAQTPRPSDSAAVIQFHADGNVRNPAATDAYPGVRRIAVRAVDNVTRPDAVVQVNDRVGVKPGERSVLFAAESDSGRVTLSELVFAAEAGVDYVVWPVVEADGRIFAELRRGAYGAVIARSKLWTPRP